MFDTDILLTVANFDQLFKSNSATFGLILIHCKTLVIVKN